MDLTTPFGNPLRAPQRKTLAVEIVARRLQRGRVADEVHLLAEEFLAGRQLRLELGEEASSLVDGALVEAKEEVDGQIGHALRREDDGVVAGLERDGLRAAERDVDGPRRSWTRGQSLRRCCSSRPPSRFRRPCERAVRIVDHAGGTPVGEEALGGRRWRLRRNSSGRSRRLGGSWRGRRSALRRQFFRGTPGSSWSASAENRPGTGDVSLRPQHRHRLWVLWRQLGDFFGAADDIRQGVVIELVGLRRAAAQPVVGRHLDDAASRRSRWW